MNCGDIMRKKMKKKSLQRRWQTSAGGRRGRKSQKYVNHENNIKHVCRLSTRQQRRHGKEGGIAEYASRIDLA